MRATQRCPKCNETPVLFLPSIPDRDSRGGDRPTALHHVSGLFDLLAGKSSTGHLQIYICLACGFSELYTYRPQEIPHQEIEGAEVLWADDAAEDEAAWRAMQSLRDKPR